MSIHKVADAIWKDTFAEHSPEDSELWLDLVMFASVMNDDLAAILIYLRNAGTQLKSDNKYGYRLVPVIGITGWESQEQYQQEALYLKPYRTQLIHCLRKLQDKNDK